MNTKSKRSIFTVLLICAFFYMIGCSSEIPAAERYIDPDHGSAVKLEGRVVLVSVFANDASTGWNYASDADRQLMASSLVNLRLAANYLSRQVQRFGKQVSFVYDWEADRDLVYSAYFDSGLVTADGSNYATQQQWLVDNVDACHLLEKYDADSIVFIYFFNTDYSNPIYSWSLNSASGDVITWEYSNFYLKFNELDMPPSSYAHEIMHAFGAPDLYYANEFIPQEYVDHLYDTASKDIMYTVSMSPEIIEEVSDLDAYYVGIAPRPEEADQWSLGISEHDPN